MTPPSNSRTRSQQDRQNSRELLSIYGTLLTPKQYAMTSGYCLEGKTFSQIAREQGVSRQAVHEAVRGVQRLLRYYDERLKLSQFRSTGSAKSGKKEAPQASPARKAIADAIDQLDSLRGRVKRQGIIYGAEWIIQEINETIRLLDPETASAASPNRGAETKKKAGR